MVPGIALPSVCIVRFVPSRDRTPLAHLLGQKEMVARHHRPEPWPSGESCHAKPESKSNPPPPPPPPRSPIQAWPACFVNFTRVCGLASCSCMRTHHLVLINNVSDAVTTPRRPYPAFRMLCSKYFSPQENSFSEHLQIGHQMDAPGWGGSLLEMSCARQMT
ncbi:uncharacterized protein CANTADRAFT_196115 [Suhomyces tanzawaensis NRRL Y-17324]|uniref:Uncharacterized protein n=1 Tax=Suhomyces tanzawaensis NRRL Y-17324 TaxID=984487 RepID=A0A1E4SNZ7_9ASCO|nr:uncharacterized protein CANTADRAFT_196115 [Suhomyces tanzawaensis NRRL Y-17324]ODV81208.1 hypothetical protein CANTADRAFT_196115 [Suhomyces tanzawaensis NRRL Y-17324]